MISFLTLCLPGLAQFTAGETRKAVKMFLIALIGGSFTGGLVWVVCGIWSVVDHERAVARRLVPRFSAPWPAPPTWHHTPPAAHSPPHPARRGSSLGMMFKVALALFGLGLAVYNISAGNTLQSLRIFEVLEMQFAASGNP